MDRRKLSLAASYLAALFLSPIYFVAWPMTSLGLTAVQRHENATDINECPHPERDTDRYKRKPTLDWTECEQILPNVMFHVGKMIGLLTCGQAGRLVKWKLLIPSMLIGGSLLSISTPWVIIHLPGFAIVRLVAGAFQAYTLCGLYVMMAFGEPDRIRRWSIRGLFCAFYTGRAFSYYLAGLVLAMKWNTFTTFYFFGVSGLLIAGFFLWSAEGITEIKNNAGLTAMPWIEVFKSQAVRVACLATAGHVWVVVLYNTSLPKFLKECLVLDMMETGLVICLSFLSIAVVVISHGLVDDYQQYTNHIPNFIRKRLYTALSSFLPTLFLILAVDNSCEAYSACWILIMGGCFLGFFCSSVTQNLQELSRHYEFRLVCLSFACGSFIGGLAPLVVCGLAPNHFHDEWRHVTWLTFLIVNSLNSFYLFASSVKKEPWDYVERRQHLAI